MTTRQHWRDAKVLVTGARGFIAQRLCGALVDAGAHVHGVSRGRRPEGAAASEWSALDVSEPSQVRTLLHTASPDVVFHLAGHVTGSQDMANVEPALLMNLVSTVHILESAAKSGRCRVLLTGSMQEPEHDSVIPCSPYAASKWASTAYGRMFHALYQLPVVIARPMMVYGPGQWDVAKLLPYVTLALLRGESPRVSSGSRELDWVYVDDVVEGLLAAVSARGVEGKDVELGSGTLTSIRDTMALLVDVMGTNVPVQFGAVPDRPLERPRVARADEARRLIDWEATTPLRGGLERAVEWYRRQLVVGAF
jgi:UDP-glucose 4-epimerase